ncbi:MAG TPA: oxygen-independent coproporphyrinogen III oxidase [Myxococcota bacterium]|nr:oxygen-independent coproporphyrinogen III oxidase [Myxococcota bacterium]
MITPPPDLVARYRTRAPRYTSYPTAPHFHAIEPAEITAALGRVRRDVSVYVHVPFCRSLCHYCGCHVEIKGARRDLGSPYVDLLLAELDLRVGAMPGGHRADQVSIGGGTPTFLWPEDMQRLARGIRDRLPLTPAADVSVEIDPRTVDDAYLGALVDSGFNRFSFGVQDLDIEVLDAVNRHQTEEQVRACVDGVRRRGAFDLNLDLMYGLPHQTPERFQRTLDMVAELAPSRVALFLYAHVPWMKPAQKLLDRHGLPDGDVRTELFARAVRTFEAAGYRRVGMDHFARPDDELVRALDAGTLQRNFMGYTTRAGLDLLPLGVSSIGLFGDVYAQNLKDRDAWTARVEAGEIPTERGHRLTDDDRRRRRVIMELFCNFRVTLTPDEQATLGAEVARLGPLIDDGLVTVDGPHIAITSLGRHFVRNVCATFDAYLEPESGDRRYSVTA